MSRLLVGSLIREVRYQLDEINEAGVQDVRDILPSLNRAQDYGLSLITRQYENPLLTSVTVQMPGDSTTTPIPEDAFEQRIEHVESEYQPGVFSKIEPSSFRYITQIESIGNTSYPTHWAITGNDILILPRPAAGARIRIWYSKDPGQLVKEQGRIRQAVGTGQDYLVLDEVGTDLSEDMTSLESFFNVVDGQTGAVKGTFQISYVENQRIYIRPNPTQSLIETRTVSGSFDGLGIQIGDYVCSYLGSCIPILKKPLSNFLIQFAVSEVTRKLGGDAPTEEAVLRKFEEQVKKTYSGRQRQIRVTKNNANWLSPGRRYRFPR